MSNRRTTLSTLVAAAITLLAATADAQTTAPTTQATSAPFVGAAPAAGSAPGGAASSTANPDWWAPVKQPAPWLVWGGDLRLRENFTENMKLNKDDVSHEQDYQRYRTRLYTAITPIYETDSNTGKQTNILTFNARLTWEFYNWCAPEVPTASSPTGRDTDPSEAIFDILNVKYDKAFNLPLTITVGRQELLDIGSGWILGEPTPLDGSRTAFFDGARFTYKAQPIKTQFDLIYFDDASREDRWIEPFNYNAQRHPLEEQNERGGILYVSNKSIDQTVVEGYLIYRNEEKVLVNGDDASYFTFGPRVVRDFGQHWQVQGEVAEELGDKNGRDLSATGANGMLNYFTRDSWEDTFRWTLEWLSGDKKSTTGTDEGFDIFWGRYARWSEIQAITYALEQHGRPADYTNLYRFGPGWTTRPLGTSSCDSHGKACDPYPPMEILLDYNLLFAERNPMAGAPGFSDNGPFRGQLFTAWLKYKFNEHLSGHLMGEVFIPGNYYSDLRNDVALFTRAELVFSW